MKRTRRIVVNKIFQLSQNMKRITFSGNDLKDFPQDEVGGYVKFLFTEKNLVRPYSIRAFRKESLQMDIDFSNHFGDQGYATKWANNAKVGDYIYISGPGPKQNLNFEYDWFLFAGDMTALPSISVHLENLPKKTRGIVLVEVLSKNDLIELKKPKNIKIKWLVKSKQDHNAFFDTVSNIKWMDGKPFIWIACEYSKIVKFRNFFLLERKVNKKDMYISSYWKKGLNQEQHKLLKKKNNIKWSN